MSRPQVNRFAAQTRSKMCTHNDSGVTACSNAEKNDSVPGAPPSGFCPGRTFFFFEFRFDQEKKKFCGSWPRTSPGLEPDDRYGPSALQVNRSRGRGADSAHFRRSAEAPFGGGSCINEAFWGRPRLYVVICGLTIHDFIHNFRRRREKKCFLLRRENDKFLIDLY